MRKWRAVLVLIATVAVFAFSFVMLRELIGADSPWLGLLLMLYFLGIAKIAEPIFMLRIPRLRRLRSWERSDGLYHVLGVEAFGRLFRSTPLRYLNLSVYVANRRVDLQRVIRLVESAEASHFWVALLFIPCIVLAFAGGHYVAGIVFVAVEVFGNVYPILHLRLVRARLSRFEASASRKRRVLPIGGIAV